MNREFLIRSEKWVVLLVVIVFIVSHLHFDYQSKIAGLFGTNAGGFLQFMNWRTILINTILPTIICGALIYTSWYMFHYRVATRFDESKIQPKTLTYFLGSLVLIYLAHFVYGKMQLYVKPVYSYSKKSDFYDLTNIDFINKFRLLDVAKYSILTFANFLFYEILIKTLKWAKLRFSGFYKVTDTAKKLLFVLVVVLAIIVPVLLANMKIFSGIIVHFAVIFLLFISWAVGFLLVQKLYITKGKLHAAVIALLISVTGITAISIILFTGREGSFYNSLLEYFFAFFVSVLALWITIILSVVIKVSLTKQNTILKKEVSEKVAELSQLRGQVNPHFLFNALNSLYSVALKENAKTTATGIQKLGDMMRFMLNENHQEIIPIEKEVEQLQNYIDIQRIRIDESQDINIEVNLMAPSQTEYLAPMLLNPFVENAFKHGISFRNPSWIRVMLTFDEQNLYFKVHNSLHKTKDIDPEKANHGIGLENVKKRLGLIYPGKHSLVIQESEQDFFVLLSIRLK